MIFEFLVARKYLIPRKRQLSMSLIALTSVGVISLVVWLILVFLSVTSGIEKNWLSKLTAISAPIRLHPTDAYYASYYYQVDGISSQSDYAYKSIGEKLASQSTDPYLPYLDQEIPKEWPHRIQNSDGSTKDLVKETFTLLNALNLNAQEYETSGAILNLEMAAPRSLFVPSSHSKEGRYLIQLFYLSTFNGKNPNLKTLIEPPRIEDLNHLFVAPPLSLIDGNAEGHADRFREYLGRIIPYISIKTIHTISNRWDTLRHLISEGMQLDAQPLFRKGRLVQLVFPLEKLHSLQAPLQPFGKVVKKENGFYFIGADGAECLVDPCVPWLIPDRLIMQATLSPPVLDQISQLRDLSFTVTTQFQGYDLEGCIPWEGVEIAQATITTAFDTLPAISPVWPYFVEERGYLPQSNTSFPVILPKCLQKSGVLMGDGGQLCYGGGMGRSIQEQCLPITVCGFYDPGVIPVGGKIALTPPELPHIINQAYDALNDPSMKNGIQVYTNDLKQVKKIKRTIESALRQNRLNPYWEVTTFEEYDFARDLLQQFQSDKYLFTLIAVIVLIVGCSNILSFLILLVNDKRKEIAILSAMGTSKKSIALIFTLCGGMIGTLSTCIGTLCAILTLHYIEGVIHFLSVLQGHGAFHAGLFATSLPNQLSHDALIFVLIATPTISLLAGLIPALKAAKLHPSDILRAE